MARVVVALCLAHAAVVGDALGYGVPKKDPLEVPSEAYDVNADPDNTALVPITALGIPAVPGVPTVSGLAGPPNPADVKGLAAGGPSPLNAVLNAVINAGADSTLGTPTGIKFKDVASGEEKTMSQAALIGDARLGGPADSLKDLRLYDASGLTTCMPTAWKSGLGDEATEDYAISLLTDRDTANEAYWSLLSSSYSAASLQAVWTLVKKVADQAALDELAALFEEAGIVNGIFFITEQIFDKGELYAVSTMEPLVVPPREGIPQDPDQPIYPVGSVVLLERVGTKLVPYCVILKSVDGAMGVYYSTSTDSAWALALYHAKIALRQLGTWVTYKRDFHFYGAALEWTQRNSLEPDHPVRVLLEQSYNGANQWFGTSVFAEPVVTAVTPGAIDSPEDVQAQNLAAGPPPPSTFAEFEPIVRAGLNGLDLDEVDVPVLAMNQRLWEEAKKLADAFVAAVYSSDADVEADVQLQAWVAAAADPTQGNVPKLFDGGISTIAEVTALLTYMIYLPIAHTVQNLPIYIAGSFSEVLLPSAAMKLALPDPTQTYTMENLLEEWLPSAFAVGKTCTFVGIALLRYVDEMGMAPDAPPENPPSAVPSPMSVEYPSEAMQLFADLPVTHPINVAQEALRVAQLDIFMENARPGFCAIVYGDEEKCREATAARMSRVMTF